MNYLKIVVTKMSAVGLGLNPGLPVHGTDILPYEHIWQMSTKTTS